MARLFVLSGAAIGTTFDIDGTVVLGRGDEADVVLREPSVSRKHAELVPQLETGVWRVVDLKSSNGLHCGGRRVREAIVRDGDTFKLGEVEIRLRDDTAAEDWSGVESGDEMPTAGDASGGFELEFGDDIDREIAKAPKSVGRAQAPEPPRQPAADEAGARATRERAVRRAAAVGSSGRPVGGAAASEAGGGRPVLQYSQKGTKGVELNQLPAGLRTLIIVGAVAVALGVAYGAFALTRTARSQASALSE